jgi:hypothetical protein
MHVKPMSMATGVSARATRDDAPIRTSANAAQQQ